MKLPKTHELALLARQGKLHEVPRYQLTEKALTTRDRDGFTVLHLCAIHGHLKIIPAEILADNLMLEDGDGYSVLAKACSHGHLDQIPDNLLTQENMTKLITYEGSAVEGWSPLGLAVQNAADAIPKRFLTKENLLKEVGKVDVTKKGRPCGTTCYHTAASSGVIKLLPLDAEVLKTRNTDKDTVLHVAAECGTLDQIPYELLTEESMTLLGADDETPIHTAAMMSHLEQVPHAVMNEKTLTMLDTEGCSVIFRAAAGGIKHIPKDLLSLKNLTQQSKLGTPIYRAASTGFLADIPGKFLTLETLSMDCFQDTPALWFSNQWEAVPELSSTGWPSLNDARKKEWYAVFEKYKIEVPVRVSKDWRHLEKAGAWQEL